MRKVRLGFQSRISIVSMRKHLSLGDIELVYEFYHTHEMVFLCLLNLYDSSYNVICL